MTLAGVAVAVGGLFRRRGPEGFSATGRHGTPPSADSIASGYEVKDIHVRNTVFILVGMAATTALVVGIVFTTIWRFELNRNAVFSALTPEQTARVVPPAPHLQRDPFLELAQEQSRENYLLHSYGWTSADHSTARIPIDRAMAETVGKSLDAGP
jgi:hypothetical protein